MIFELKEAAVLSVRAARGRGVPWVFLTLRAAVHTQTRDSCLFYITAILKKFPAFMALTFVLQYFGNERGVFISSTGSQWNKLVLVPVVMTLSSSKCYRRCF